MSFFGFNTALPDDTRGGAGGFGGFANQSNTAFGGLGDIGAEEDIAVYNWGDANTFGGLEGDDGMNDETFGGSGDVGNDFNFGHAAPQAAAPASSTKGKIASTQSRYKPKVAVDPFAFSEDDFYSSRRSGQKPAKSTPKPKAAVPAPIAAPARTAETGRIESLWGQPQAPPTMWGASPASSLKPSGPAAIGAGARSGGPPPAGQIKTLDEIEAEMSRLATDEQAPSAQPPSQSRPAPQMQSLEEIERQMMAASDDSSPQAPQPASFQAQPPAPLVAPPREVTPPQINLAGSGYTSQALLDSMFPELGAAAPGGSTASFPGQQPGVASADPSGNGNGNAVSGPQPSPEEMARIQALHERVQDKIAGMAKHNHLMGNSDKDFITRIQLSQLATADPYTSDFYAQVFSAIRQRSAPEPQQQQGPQGPKDVVPVTQGFAFGVSGPTGNRFGKMGQQTMQKLSSQVKKLVENRAHRTANTAALQGALGKVARSGVSGPRPVLAVPAPTTAPGSRPTNILNNQTGIRRAALTKKQVLFALEELYDKVLELEQARREMPPPPAVPEVEAWAAGCAARVDDIWRRLMIMEPLDVSNPHPFISLLDSTKGQRLFPRLLRHLDQHQSLTLLTLLIATYPQLDVVQRAPPPPVVDASLLTKADRADRARREAETDSFLHCIVPGVDMLIQRSGLGLVAGLLGICTQRMDVARVASTRPGVALFTALLSKAQNLIRPTTDPSNPQGPPPAEPADVDQWTKTYAYFLSTLLPHLPELFPSSISQRAAYGPGAYLFAGESEAQALEMDRRDAEVWGFTAALAVNAPEEEQATLVGALRDKVLHAVSGARAAGVSAQRREVKLRNVNMFLNGLGLDASMIE